MLFMNICKWIEILQKEKIIGKEAKVYEKYIYFSFFYRSRSIFVIVYLNTPSDKCQIIVVQNRTLEFKDGAKNLTWCLKPIINFI